MSVRQDLLQHPARLQALHDLKLPGTDPQPRFDHITQACQQAFNVSACIIALIDDRDEWIISASLSNSNASNSNASSTNTIDPRQITAELSLCQQTLDHEGIVEVSQLSQHSQYKDNPLINILPQVNHFTGIALSCQNEFLVGTLYLLSTDTLQLDNNQKTLFENFAAIAESELSHTLLRNIEEQLNQNQHALMIENERLALATHAGSIGIWEYNIVTNELKWDDRMFELYGVRRDQFQGEYEAWSHALHPEDKKRSERELDEAIVGIKPFNTEFRVVWPNGETHYIQAAANIVRDSRGTVERMIGVNQDITERKKMEHAWKQYQFIVQSSDDAILSKSLDGTITSWNPAAERMFGYTRKEIINQPIFMLIPQDRIQEELQIIERVSAGEKIESLETQHRRKDGSLLDVSATISPILDESGQVLGVSKILRDISERKKLDLMQSEFISTVSHELRTPLTSIRGALGLIIGKYSRDMPDDPLKMLDLANRNAERLSLLVNDILDLEKIQSGALELELVPVDMIVLAQRAYEENLGFADKHQVLLKLQIKTHGATVLGDQQRLLQVFANLISNAVKFSPTNGTVDITIETQGNLVEASITDRGSGIPEEFRERIFQRFAQADSSDTREKSGTGLGLSISKAIIDRHMGVIGYESSSTQGTRFYFQLPAEHSTQGNSTLHREQRKLVNLALICEDNHAVAQVLQSILSEEGVISDICNTLASTRNNLKNRPYDLLILDLNLPDANGIELLDELASSTRQSDIPVIVVSAHADNVKVQHKPDYHNVVEWLQKPVNTDYLKKLLYLLQHEKARILHIDDDMDILQVTEPMVRDFSEYHYASSVTEARSALQQQDFDLIFLDLTLPDGNGIELMQAIPDNCSVIIFSRSPGQHSDTRIKATLNKSFANIKHLRSAALQALSSSLHELHK